MRSKVTVRSSVDRGLGDADSENSSDSTRLLIDLALVGPAPYLVRRLQQVATAIFSDEMGEYGITAPQYAALSVVVARPNLDQNTTAFLAGVERTTIVGVINRLVRKGLVRRKVSKADRRVRLLSPTVEGIRFFQKVNAPIERIGTRLLEPCSARERELFCDVARRLLRDRLLLEAQQLAAIPTNSGSEVKQRRSVRRRQRR
jgi:DNA-binding MarR family transcriptional regulator